MLLDLLRQLRHSRTKKSEKDGHREVSSSDFGGAGERLSGTPTSRGGFFANSSGFTVQNSTMLDFQNTQIQNFIVQTIINGTAVLERLLPHICEGAFVYSGARHPPPRCHPGTREKIQNILVRWLEAEIRDWKIVWLYGPAGTGKSAVAQTFAEYCYQAARLGASYFFSRANGRNDPKTVIPSLAYQLATFCPDYKELLTTTIAHDPLILESSPRAQFAHLITRPFDTLRQRDGRLSQHPLVIVLDGLDECNGMELQCELIEIIREAMALKDLPFLWLIVGRPEPHLMYTFSRVDFPVKCDKRQLLIDNATRQDVRRFLRDGFSKIEANFMSAQSGSWPSPEIFEEVVEIADGLFALAAAMLGYVGDTTYASPAERLLSLLAFIEHADQLAGDNPLQTLDLLYSRILMDVPSTLLSKTQILLCHFTWDFPDLATQALANFLHMDRDMFYTVLRPLHSVLAVPSAEEAPERQMTMYHTSFRDYLSNPARSGRFCVYASDILAEYIKLKLSWYEIIWRTHASDDLLEWSGSELHPSIYQHLTWTSVECSEHIFRQVNAFINRLPPPWGYISTTAQTDPEDFFQFLNNFDFRYIPLEVSGLYCFLDCMNWLYGTQQIRTPPLLLLRTAPVRALEQVLFDSVIASRPNLAVMPISFPICSLKNTRSIWQYFFLGHGQRTCLFFTDERCGFLGRCRLGRRVQSEADYGVDDCVVHVPEDDGRDSVFLLDM